MDNYVVEPIVVDDLHQALDMAGRRVQSVVERINMFLPRMRSSIQAFRSDSIYLPRVHAHFQFVANKSEIFAISEYYAHLQSFVYDFEFPFTEIACEAVSSFAESGKADNMLMLMHRYSALEAAEALFIKHAELNPYLCFMRGQMSANTVVMLAVNNLQIALAFDLLNQTSVHGNTILSSTYQGSIETRLGLSRGL